MQLLGVNIPKNIKSIPEYSEQMGSAEHDILKPIWKNKNTASHLQEW
jgi:hypothetical protein